MTYNEKRLNNAIRVAKMDEIDTKIKSALSLNPEECKLKITKIAEVFSEEYGMEKDLAWDAVCAIVHDAEPQGAPTQIEIEPAETIQPTNLSPKEQVCEIVSGFKENNFETVEDMLEWLREHAYKNANGYAMVVLGVTYCDSKHSIWQDKFDVSEFKSYASYNEGVALIEKGVKRVETAFDHHDYRSVVNAYRYIKRGFGGRHKLEDLEKALEYVKKQIDEIPESENKLIELAEDSISDIQHEIGYLHKFSTLVDVVMTAINKAGIEDLAEVAKRYKGGGAVKFLFDSLPEEEESFYAMSRATLMQSSERDLSLLLTSLREAKAKVRAMGVVKPEVSVPPKVEVPKVEYPKVEPPKPEKMQTNDKFVDAASKSLSKVGICKGCGHKLDAGDKGFCPNCDMDKGKHPFAPLTKTSIENSATLVRPLRFALIGIGAFILVLIAIFNVGNILLRDHPVIGTWRTGRSTIEFLSNGNGTLLIDSIPRSLTSFTWTAEGEQLTITHSNIERTFNIRLDPYSPTMSIALWDGNRYTYNNIVGLAGEIYGIWDRSTMYGVIRGHRFEFQENGTGREITFGGVQGSETILEFKWNLEENYLTKFYCTSVEPDICDTPNTLDYSISDATLTIFWRGGLLRNGRINFTRLGVN